MQPALPSAFSQHASACIVLAYLGPIHGSNRCVCSTPTQPAGLYFMYTAHGEDPKKADSAVKNERLRKWNESCWKLTVYTFFTALAFFISFQEPWFWDTRYMWLGCNHFPPCNLHVPPKVLIFYCVQTGFYLQAVHFLIFHEVCVC